MTEREWLGCSEPGPMLASLRGEASDRKLRLFAVACCRRVWHLLTDERYRQSAEVAERYAEGLLGAAELAGAEMSVWGSVRHREDYEWTDDPAFVGLVYAARAVGHACRQPEALYPLSTLAAVVAEEAMNAEGTQGEEQAVTRAGQCALLRDIFGPLPFRPVPIDPAWRWWGGGTAARIAEDIYEWRAFDRLPVLADALEEAGCTSADLLGHCRGLGPHVRGCWAVDLILAKE